MAKKKKINPWKDWEDYEDYEEKNMLDKILLDITEHGWDVAMEMNKVEEWFKPKIKEHMDRVKDGESVQDI